MLENDYTPLIIADPELLNKWLEIKEKARQTIKDLISKDILEQETYKGVRRTVVKGETTSKTDIEGARITGESLYKCGLDYAFVKDFKTYVDEYSPEAGLVKGDGDETIDGELLIANEGFLSRHKLLLSLAKSYLDLLSIVQEKDEGGEIIVDIGSEKLKHLLTSMRDSFVKHYEILLGFDEFFKRLSKTYDMDLSYRVAGWIADIKDLVESFNNTLLDALKADTPDPFTKKKKRYKDNELFIDTTKIKPNRERVEPAFKEVGERLGEAF